MGRVIKIVIYAIVILAVWLWFSSILKSCQAPKAEIVELPGDTFDFDDSSDTLDTDESFFEDEEEPNEDITSNEEQDIDSDEYEEIDYSTLDDQLEESFEDEQTTSTTTSNTQSSTNSSPTYTATSSSGNYMIICGSYLVKSNANAMRDRLSNMGYDSEIVQFDGSQYHSVSAQRYDSHSRAQDISRKLKQAGIDNYVHRRK